MGNLQHPSGGAGHGEIVDTGIGDPDRLTRLWAPYRMSYITKRTNPEAHTSTQAAPHAGEDPTAAGADEPAAPPSSAGASGEVDGRPDPFLEVPKLSDEDGLVVARGSYVFCVLNLYPYNAGHMMVIPYRKVAHLEDLTEAESHELMRFAQAAIRTVKHVSHPDGINAGFNLGRSSGGSVRDHLHMHIVPRWGGDANFMTVIDGTKVLPQVLRDTRSILAAQWASDPECPGVARA